MRRRFSMGQALGAPFGLLKRRPVTIFVWGLARLAAVIAVCALMLPMFAAVDWSAVNSETGPDMASFVRLEAGIQGANLASMVLGLIVFTAGMRATLSRRGDGFAFLRIGMDELRVALTGLAIAIAIYFAILVAVLIGVAVGLAVWTLGADIAVPVIVAYGGVVLLAALWATARVILIVPVSLIEKTFAFEAGWALGRGQAAKLAVTAVLSGLIVWVIEIVFVAVIVIAGLTLAAMSGVDWADIDWSGAGRPTADEVVAMLRPLWPLLIFILPGILLTGFASAMSSAPLASAARQLLDSGERKTPSADFDPFDDGLSPIVPATPVAAAWAGTDPHDTDAQLPSGAVSDGSATDDDHALNAATDDDGHDEPVHGDAGHDANGRHDEAAREDPDPQAGPEDPHPSQPKDGDGH